MQLGGRQRRDEVLIGCSESDVRGGLALMCTYHAFDLLLRLQLAQHGYFVYSHHQNIFMLLFFGAFVRLETQYSGSLCSV